MYKLVRNNFLSKKLTSFTDLPTQLSLILSSKSISVLFHDKLKIDTKELNCICKRQNYEKYINFFDLSLDFICCSDLNDSIDSRNHPICTNFLSSNKSWYFLLTNKIEKFKRLYERNKFPIANNMFKICSKNDNLDFIILLCNLVSNHEYLYTRHVCNSDDRYYNYVYDDVIENNSINIIGYVLAKGIMWSTEQYKIAMINGHLDLIKYVVDSGYNFKIAKIRHQYEKFLSKNKTINRNKLKKITECMNYFDTLIRKFYPNNTSGTYHFSRLKNKLIKID